VGAPHELFARPPLSPLFHLYTLAPLYLQCQSGCSRKTLLLDLSRTRGPPTCLDPAGKRSFTGVVLGMVKGALASFVMPAGTLLNLRVCEEDVFKGFYEKAKSLTNSNVVRIGIIYDDDQISACRDEDFKKLGVDAEGITREADVTYPVLVEAAVWGPGGIGLVGVDIDRNEKGALNWT